MFEVNFETEGLGVIEQTLAALNELGSKLGSVELHTRKRQDNEATNAQILDGLKKKGKDFLAQSDADNEEIAKAFADEIERILGQEFSKQAVVDRFEAKGYEDLGKFTNNLATNALQKAMKKFMSQVSKRIDEGETNNPPLDDLKTNYKKYKERVAGFIYPIGKFTGQLIDNLNPDGLGSRNIRVKRG